MELFCVVQIRRICQILLFSVYALIFDLNQLTSVTLTIFVIVKSILTVLIFVVYLGLSRYGILIFSLFCIQALNALANLIDLNNWLTWILAYNNTKKLSAEMLKSPYKFYRLSFFVFRMNACVEMFIQRFIIGKVLKESLLNWSLLTGHCQMTNSTYYFNQQFCNIFLPSILMNASDAGTPCFRRGNDRKSRFSCTSKPTGITLAGMSTLLLMASCRASAVS